MYFSLSIFIFVEARGALMSCTQHILHSSSRPYPDILWSEKGSSRFSNSKECSSLNMVFMTNKDDFLARSNQLGSSMVMIIMSSTNPYIGAFSDWLQLPVVLTGLAGLKEVGSYPLRVSVYEVIVDFMCPMMRLWGDNPQCIFLPHCWWCILMLQAFFQRASAGR